MNFGQLIEYNMENIFLEKLYTKRGGEASLGPFVKTKIEHINSLKCFYCMSKSMSIKIC